MPEKKKEDYSIFRYVAYFIRNEFGNRGAGEEKNLEFLGKKLLGGEEGGGGEGVNELCQKKNIQTFIINSTLYCLSLAFGLNGFAHIPPII